MGPVDRQGLADSAVQLVHVQRGEQGGGGICLWEEERERGG